MSANRMENSSKSICEESVTWLPVEAAERLAAL
jgi:hypothetical protein